jgi:hypothetical protein
MGGGNTRINMVSEQLLENSFADWYCAICAFRTAILKDHVGRELLHVTSVT